MANNKKTEAPKETVNAAENEAIKAENEALKAKLEALKAKATTEPTSAEAPKETGPKMVKIRIPRTRADQEDVFVSVNMYTCVIKRGVEVEVPDFVAEVLRHQEEMLEQIMLFEDKVKKDK